MLKRMWRVALLALALMSALGGPFVTAAHADCVAVGSGGVCPPPQ